MERSEEYKRIVKQFICVPSRSEADRRGDNKSMTKWSLNKNAGKLASKNLQRVHCSVFRVQKERYAPLAQLVEQLTLNQWVPGSNP